MQCWRFVVNMIIQVISCDVPRTVVIHFPDATLTHRTVVSSFRFDTTAFRALEEDLAFFEAQLLNHFFRGISFGHGSLHSRKQS